MMLYRYFSIFLVVTTANLLSIHALVPPKTPVLSGFEPAAIGSYRELVCDAYQPGAGTITYKWYKYFIDWESKGPIGTSQKYIFNPVTEKRVFHTGGYPEYVRGKYKCRASNSAGTRDSESGDLNVYKDCSLYTVSVSPSKPTIGSTFTVNCDIPNPSGHTITWTKRSDAGAHTVATLNSRKCETSVGHYTWGSCSPPSRSKSRMFKIHVTNARTSDSGYWSCGDIGLSCIKSNPVKIVVRVPPGKPQITGFPSGPVVVGTQLNLKCVASPPGDTYDWYKDNTKLTTSSSYDFLVKKESGGVYKCVARNAGGSATSSDKTLTVYYKPDSVVVSSGKTSSHVGEKDKFTCTATGGNPTPTLKIYFKGVEVTQGQERVMAKEDNQAEYYCEATVPGYPALTKRSSSKTYSVTFPNTKVFFINNPTIPTAAVQAGQVKTFRCETDESNPITSIKWFMNIGSTSFREITTGISASERNGVYGGKIRISDLSITATKAMNGATVRCTANYDLTGHEFTTLADTTMNVKFPPDGIQLSETSITVREGESKTITCRTTSSSNPAVSVSVKKKLGSTEVDVTGSPSVTNGANSGKDVSVDIKLDTNRKDNGAQYICTATYASTTTFRKTATVNVLYPPSASLSSNPKTVKEGDDVTLTCKASGGNPTSYSYSWYYNNKEIQNEKSRIYTVRAIKYTQTGPYQCRVVNYSPGGVGDATLNLNILYKAKWNPDFSKIVRVARKPSESVTFVLHVIANPPPTDVTWMDKDNKPATDQGFSAAKVNGKTYKLSKKAIMTSDYGNYTVNVKNNVGSSTFIFKLQESGPPYTPCCLRVVSVTAVSVNLTFKSNFSGGSPQTFTVEVSDSDNAREVKNIADPGLSKNVYKKISELKNGTDYQFRVKAVNTNGSSDYGDYLKVKTKATPPVYPKVVRDGNEIKVSWPTIDNVYNDSRIQIRRCLRKITSISQLDSCKIVSDTGDQGDSRTFGLEASKTDHYYLEIIDGEDQVYYEEIEIPDKVPYAAIGGAVGGILFILAIVLVVVFVIRKRRVEKGEKILSKPEKTGEVNPAFTDVHVDDGFNPYENERIEMASSPPNGTGAAAGGAAVNKTKSHPVDSGYIDVELTQEKGGVKEGVLIAPEAQPYAQVDLGKKKKKGKGKGSAPSAGPGGAVYAEVQKKKDPAPVGTEYAQVDLSKKRGKKDAGPAPAGDVYAEVNKPKKGQKPGKKGSDDTAVYANVNQGGDDNVYEDVRSGGPSGSGYGQGGPRIGVDGTIYTMVNLKPPKNPDVIRGKETIEDPYASVDFSREAPPLPAPEDPDDKDDPGFMQLI